MPIYVYESITDDSSKVQRFEFFQQMTDAPLTEHPDTGEPIQRVVTAPSVPAKGRTSMSTEKMLSDKNLDRLGFTKYVKTDYGEYEKRAGQGPDNISAWGEDGKPRA